MDSHQRRKVLIFFAIAIFIRVILYFFLYSRGYFYGKSWDTFSRTLLSYYWSLDPYFAPSDGYWLPLQFWINGLVFLAIRPWYPYSSLAVPLVINNLFFIGSLLITYKILSAFTFDRSFSSLGLWALSFFSADIFITFSGLCEPMLNFLFLASSYYLYKLLTTNHQKYIIAISIVSLLASATHYIGWFLSLFFVLFFFGWITKNWLISRKVEVTYFVPLFSSIIMPVIWLTNAYLRFGSPLYPLQVIRYMEKPYLGHMDFLSRALLIPKVMFLDIGVISIIGSIALVIFSLKKDRKILVSLPSCFVLFLLWITTTSGASNPYREPRYLVFYGWVVYPLIVSLVRELTSRKAGLVIIFIVFAVYIVQNFVQLVNYENSFNRSLEIVSLEIRPWCYKQSNDLPIIIISNSFAESGVLPVLSGCPDRILTLTKSQFTEKVSSIIFERKCTLIVTKSKSIAEQAHIQQMTYKKIGRYFIIYCRISSSFY